MILDTDILIDIDRGHPNALAWIASLTALPMISGFAALELIQGCRNKSELTKVETFLSVFPLVWPDEADMQWTFANYGQYRLTHNMGILDCLIAATAMGASVPVATFNRKHFEAVPGLATIQPYSK